MNELFTEFPSLHPLVVHFPIVCLTVVPGFYLLGILLGKKEILLTSLILTGFGLSSSIVASYVFHAEVWDATPEINSVVEQHESFATYTLISAVISFAAQLAGYIFDVRIQGFKSLHSRMAPKILLMALVSIPAVFVAATGHLGARLTHVFNVEAD